MGDEESLEQQIGESDRSKGRQEPTIDLPDRRKASENNSTKTKFSCQRFARNIVGLAEVIAAVVTERAWNYASLTNVGFAAVAGRTASAVAELKIVDRGKTPAQQVFTHILLDILPNNTVWKPNYWKASNDLIANIIVPGLPLALKAVNEHLKLISFCSSRCRRLISTYSGQHDDSHGFIDTLPDPF